MPLQVLLCSVWPCLLTTEVVLTILLCPFLHLTFLLQSITADVRASGGHLQLQVDIAMVIDSLDCNILNQIKTCVIFKKTVTRGSLCASILVDHTFAFCIDTHNYSTSWIRNNALITSARHQIRQHIKISFLNLMCLSTENPGKRKDICTCNKRQSKTWRSAVPVLSGQGDGWVR